MTQENEIPEYQDLIRKPDFETHITAWITQTLNPTLDEISELRKSAHTHKGVLYDMGRLSSGLHMEIGRWLVEAEREFTRAHAQHTRSVREMAKKDKDKEDVIKADIRESVADHKQIVDHLRYTRDSLERNLSFFQTAIRSMRDDEFVPQGDTFS